MKEFRKRARQACVACNARRVKCNVAEGVPCRNCAVRDLECEVRESRRGRHRRPQKSFSLSASDNPTPPSPRRHGPVTDGPDRQADVDDFAASEVLATLSQDVRRGDAEQVEADGRVGGKPTDPPDRRGQVHFPDGERSVFLGESTSVRYVNEVTPSEKTQTPQSVRLLHQVPDTPSKAVDPVSQLEEERRRSKTAWLQSQGVFALPEPATIEALLKLYFQWFHPCFSLVNEPDIWSQVRQGTISPLLLNALLFVATVHCDDDSLRSMGLQSQIREKYAFYNRAKDIYHADQEAQRLVVIQSLFLLSFWRAGPLLEKDARHWLAAAISLAQSKALHRSASQSTEASCHSLGKRIWWAIYVRERQCAAALGLPNRIRDEDCDVEPLRYRDFDQAFGSSVGPQLASQYIAYQTGMADLSRFLGQIVHSGYLPGKRLTPPRRDSIRDQLTAWKRELPANMQPDPDLERPAPFHVCMLHLAYNNLLVLLHRTDYLEHGADMSGGRIALQAASQTSRIIEDLLPEGNLRHSQVHVITNLFNALCIHSIHLRRTEGAGVAIAEHRAKMCLLGLNELQKTWEMQNWILQLFFQYLDYSTAARLLAQPEPSRALAEQVRSRRESRRVSPAPDAPPTPANQGDERPGPPDTPWLWSTEQQTQFLLTHIEDSFAFGEGTMYDWGGEGLGPGAMMPQLEEPAGADGWR